MVLITSRRGVRPGANAAVRSMPNASAAAPKAARASGTSAGPGAAGATVKAAGERPSVRANGAWNTSSNTATSISNRVILRPAGMLMRAHPWATAWRRRESLVVLFGNRVSEIPFTAGHGFSQHGLWIRIEDNDSFIRSPRPEQHFGIIDGSLPGERIPFASQALDDMHVFGVEIAAHLIEVGRAIEADGVDHQRVAFPMADALAVVGSVQIVERSVLAPVSWDDAIAGLSGQQAALARIDENHSVAGLTDL